MEKQYWLGNYKDVNKYGWSMDVELIDGPHSEPKGVREAKHIIRGIGLDKGKEQNYVMVTIEDIPQGEVDVNEEVIEQNRQVVEHNSKPIFKNKSMTNKVVEEASKQISKNIRPPKRIRDGKV